MKKMSVLQRFDQETYNVQTIFQSYKYNKDYSGVCYKTKILFYFFYF